MYYAAHIHQSITVVTCADAADGVNARVQSLSLSCFRNQFNPFPTKFNGEKCRSRNPVKQTFLHSYQPSPIATPGAPMEESSHLLLNQHAEIEASERNRMAPTTQPTITRSKHKVLVLMFVVFSIVMGYIAATQPKSKGWRFFSYHPLLMTVGFVGCMGSASVTKKLMGYSNTKIHAVVGAIGLLLAYGAL